MNDEVEEHPAYGLASFSKVSGRQRMFCSEFEHQHYVCLTISRAKRYRSIHRSWNSNAKELISIRMSEAQFVELISRPNMGVGVPVTLEHVLHERMPDIPVVKTDRQRHEEEFSEACKKLALKLYKGIAKLKDVLAPGGALNKKNVGEALGFIESAEQDIRANLPFTEQSFAESMETTVTAAKIEIEAHITNAIVHAGLEALGIPKLKMIEAAEKAEADAE